MDYKSGNKNKKEEISLFIFYAEKVNIYK